MHYRNISYLAYLKIKINNDDNNNTTENNLSPAGLDPAFPTFRIMVFQ